MSKVDSTEVLRMKFVFDKCIKLMKEKKNVKIKEIDVVWFNNKV